MRFVKMQGAGNDFILLDAFRDSVSITAPEAKELCDRHFGIGADGVLVLSPSGCADARMIVYNSDGTLAEMCGNGLRCAARYLLDTGRGDGGVCIETGAGVLSAKAPNPADTSMILTNMGRPEFRPERIPVASERENVVINLGGTDVRFDCASMGNPHAVTYDLYPERAAFLSYGALVERHALFPNRVNVEFCRAIARDCVEIRVWERGDGETLACGTGACAAFAVGRRRGMLDSPCRMRLPGGQLIAEEENGSILLTGPAQYVYTGEVTPRP